MTLPVSLPPIPLTQSLMVFQDGGWLKANPIPSDKGKYGHFDEIALQNKRLLQQIVSQDSSARFSTASELMKDPYDEALLDLLPVLDSLRFTSDVRRVLGLRIAGSL